MAAESENPIRNAKGAVDSDLVAFFDLLARFDYENKQREKSALKTDPPTSAPEGQF